MRCRAPTLFSSSLVFAMLSLGACSFGTQPPGGSDNDSGPASTVDAGSNAPRTDAGNGGGGDNTDAGNGGGGGNTDAGNGGGGGNTDAGNGGGGGDHGFGTDCNIDTDCDSGICRDGVCSECRGQSDCASNTECLASFALGYYACVEIVLGELGASCSGNEDCASGHCKSNVCSECRNDNHCVGAQECVDDTAGVGYFICQGGDLALGAPCDVDSACASGVCNNNTCSACQFDAECPGLATCEADFDLGYFNCVSPDPAPIGEPCVANSDCASGACVSRLGPISSVCGECLEDNQCPQGQACQFNFSEGTNLCVGTLSLGDSCNADSACRSEFCNSGHCSRCGSNADCDNGGQCEPSISNPDVFVCRGGLGDPCQSGADCGSGYCFESFNVRQCGLCEIDDDCPGDQTCSFDFFEGYATCG